MTPQANRIDFAETAQQAARFLLQATPGAARAQIDALTGRRFADWLDAQMAQPAGTSHFNWLIANG